MNGGSLRQVVLVVDVQRCFSPPEWLIERAQKLASAFPSVASVEMHDEACTPFEGQLGWVPPVEDVSLVVADHVFIKHGYGPTEEIVERLKDLRPDRVLVCGIQADTCVLAAGFALFDAGLHPTLVADAVVGSSLDRTGALGVSLWRHHFGAVEESYLPLIRTMAGG